MNWLRRAIWPLLRSILFQIDPESAHHITIRLIRASFYLRNVPVKVLVGIPREEVTPPSGPQMDEKFIFGIKFRSRVGLAAGFDKDAEILAALPDFGFGFAEIGTVTPLPQPGNDRPRLFRDPSRQSLFNRMGFNGLGAALVSSRLAEMREFLPENFRVGVNIGKNKDTPLDQASQDYLNAILPFRSLADYVVINVSSPNTPGLRSLQSEQSLQPIIQKVGQEISKWPKRVPLLLKIAPELSGETLFSLVKAVEGWGIDGWVLTNTLAGRIETSSGTLTGGWSGGMVTDGARRSLKEVRSFSRLPIISVGGILSVEEACLRMELGADLLQIYTGWVYRGPRFPQELSKKLDTVFTQKVLI